MHYDIGFSKDNELRNQQIQIIDAMIKGYNCYIIKPCGLSKSILFINI